MNNKIVSVLFFVLLAFLGAFRIADLEARLAALTATVERLERNAVAADGTAGRRLSAEKASDAGISASVAALGSRQAAPVEMARMQREIDGLRAQVQTGRTPDERIIDVVDRKREAVFAKHLDFHRERWVEGRAGALDLFSKAAKLTNRQQEQLDELLTDEIDRVMELLRDPSIRDEPGRLAEAWDEEFNETDAQVRSFLVPFQRERWEQARAYERAKFFPWLPK